MIDTHCHLLPGVDDGPPDLDAAVAICRRAAEDGCTAMVATPHLRHELWWNGDRRALETRWRRLREAVGGAPEIHLGGEIAVNSQSVEEMIRGSETLLTLAGSRYLLLELDWRGVGPDPEELIHELAVAGRFPVIAHPERIPWLVGDPPLVLRLLELGATLQVTARALSGEMGRAAQAASRALMDAGLVQFIASDAHDLRTRPPGLRATYELVVATWGEPVARRLFEDNPRAVLEDRPLGENAGAGPRPAAERLSRIESR